MVPSALRTVRTATDYSGSPQLLQTVAPGKLRAPHPEQLVIEGWPRMITLPPPGAGDTLAIGM